jgi:hypothetical protein
VVWWIVGGVLALAVLIFLVVLAVLGSRLRPLKRAADRLEISAEAAQRLQARVEQTRERAMAVQSGVEQLTAAAEHLRGTAPPGGTAQTG